MADGDETVSRRGLLRAAAGAGAATAATGPAAAASEGGGGSNAEPDYGDWVSQTSNYSQTQDLRGEDQITITVGAEGNGGALAFSPPAVWIDPGTEVVWEWTGRGGAHNVVGENVDFSSGNPVSQEGTTYSRTFEESGIVKYYCSPHRDQGMVGGIAVGDVPTVVERGFESALPDSAKTLGVATVAGMTSVLGLAYFFMKYGGDYGEFEEEA